MKDQARIGGLAIVGACAIWGFAPLFYHHLAEVPPVEMMAHRTIWTAVLFGLWLGLRGGWGAVWELRRQALRVGAAAALIGFNWLLFIWAVAGGHALQASLGYYIYPLVSALLGVVIFHERLRGLQALGIGLAGLAVLVLTLGLGVAPVVSLALAVSFAGYAAVKRGVQAPALAGVLAEVLVITPALLVWLAFHGEGWFGRDLYHTLMLPIAGPISGLPLVLFSYGAARVRMATSGLIQYLNPTVQFFSAWAILGEAVSPWHGLALALIWAAIALYFWPSRSSASSSVTT